MNMFLISSSSSDAAEWGSKRWGGVRVRTDQPCAGTVEEIAGCHAALLASSPRMQSSQFEEYELWACFEAPDVGSTC